MSVINVNQLKARFATRDKPTQKDFVDLIDTLLAGAGATEPTGPASGALDGSYPNPTLHTESSDVDDANRPVSANSIQNGAVELKKLDPTGSSTGDVPTRTLGGIAWQSPAGAGGGGGTTPNVSGAIRSFTSALQAMPAADGVTNVDAPASFGTTPPQHVRITATFLTSFANYSAGDEIDVELCRVLADPNIPCFYVSSFINAGVLRFAVRVEYGNVAGSVGFSIFDKTLTTAPPIGNALIPFSAVADIQDTIEFRVYASRYEEGSGFGSISAFQPVNVSVPAAGALSTFTHNFGVQPSFKPKVSLVCSTAELNYTAGDVISVDEAFDVSGGNVVNPAFAVTSNLTQVLVRREATTISIPNKTTGALATMDTTKWQLACEAYRAISVPTLVFPATQFEVSNPNAGIGYGSLMYFFHQDRHSTRSYLNSLDLTNSNVSKVFEFNPPHVQMVPSLYRFPNSAGPVLDYLCWCDTKGIHRMRLDTLAITTLISGDYSNYRPVDFKEEGADPTAHPSILIAVDNFASGSGQVNLHLAKKLTWGGSSYSTANKQSVNWLTLASSFGGTPSIFTGYNVGGNQNILAFQFNPIKRRFYMITDSCAFVFIYKFQGGFTDQLIDWWDSSVDGTVIDFEKAIVLPGTPGSQWASTDWDKWSIEWDLASGVEKSVTVNRIGNSSLTGSIARIPWVE
jgi:hypothetical protein